MPATPSIRFVVSRRDTLLQDTIARMSRATGRTVKEETRTTMKGIVRDALDINPPGSAGVRGQSAKSAGEKAIVRDLRKMGFAPKDIKGFRIITTAFGHQITPVRVKTKENPKFVDPDAIHIARLRGGKTRGGKQAWYVSRAKYTSMLARLKKQVGKLSSGWVPAALALGVTIPAWISRHSGSGRGSHLQIIESAHRITMRAINHFPVTAQKEADEMIRRIQYLKQYAIGRLKRQLPYILHRNLRAAKR